MFCGNRSDPCALISNSAKVSLPFILSDVLTKLPIQERGLIQLLKHWIKCIAAFVLVTLALNSHSASTLMVTANHLIEESTQYYM